MTNAEIIKERVSLLELFGVLGIGVKGKHALCPFHEDKRPSMAFRESGLWHCFVCNLGGDIITFVMHHEKTDFKGALAWLNEKFGLGLDYKKPKRNYYLEALNENYEQIKKILLKEKEDNIWRSWLLKNTHQWKWTASDFTFDILYDETMDLLDDKLRELENAKYKLRKSSTSTF